MRDYVNYYKGEHEVWDEEGENLLDVYNVTYHVFVTPATHWDPEECSDNQDETWFKNGKRISEKDVAQEIGQDVMDEIISEAKEVDHKTIKQFNLEEQYG